MKKMLTLFCLGLAACDGSMHGDWRLQRGMTEQEVTQLDGKQMPDRITIAAWPVRPRDCRRFRGRPRAMGVSRWRVNVER
jgi:hypothetical protein